MNLDRSVGRDMAPLAERPSYNAKPTDWVRYANHLEQELRRVSEEYALQRAQIIDALTSCRCPVGFGQVAAEDCPRHNPRPRHTISGVSVDR